MRLLLSFTALFLSIALLQLASGALAPLDALSGLASGFSKAEVGLLGSAHFVGFFVGCWAAPRLMGSVGHVRCFAAFAAIGTIAIVAHPLLIDPLAWAGMRIGTGMALAGCYTVAEAWMNAKVTNETRARTVGTYRVVDLMASLIAQLLIGALEPAAYASYIVLAMLCCASLVPLLMTTSVPPKAPSAPRLRPFFAFQLSPLAAVGVMVAGVTLPAFRMVGPVYAQEIGLPPERIGVFLAMALFGGALAQWPVGWLADRYDRRSVLIGISILSVGVCAWFSQITSEVTVFVAAFVFGLVTMPVFSISAAHANDFAPADSIVELSAALMFLYGIGAIASPLIASLLIETAGPGAMFSLIAAAHVGLIGFALIRRRARPGASVRTPYRYLPRTSFVLARLVRGKAREE